MVVDCDNRGTAWISSNGSTTTTTFVCGVTGSISEKYIYDPFAGWIKKDYPKPNYSLPDVEVLFDE